MQNILQILPTDVAIRENEIVQFYSKTLCCSTQPHILFSLQLYNGF